MVERRRLGDGKRREGVAQLVEFMHRRDYIRFLRAQGKDPPWTNDPILEMYRFTNVRRKDDRVSRWILEHVSPQITEPTLANIQFVALCRWVNWPPTISAIMEAGHWPSEHLNLPAIGALVDKRTASGVKTWTGAYMIRAQPDHKGGKGEFIAEQVVGRALRRAWPEIWFMLKTRMRRPVWRVLVDCLNWGSFMAGQVVDDLTWTPLLSQPRDDLSWAPQGPGSLRGLNRVLGRPLGTRHDELSWCQELQHILWSDPFQKFQQNHQLLLTLMDAQSCLCEYDKYERVRLGEGRPRSLYRPEDAY